MEARRTIRHIVAIVVLALALAAAGRYFGRALAQRYPAIAAIEALFFHDPPQGS